MPEHVDLLVQVAQELSEKAEAKAGMLIDHESARPRSQVEQLK